MIGNIQFLYVSSNNHTDIAFLLASLTSLSFSVTGNTAYKSYSDILQAFIFVNVHDLQLLHMINSKDFFKTEMSARYARGRLLT